MRLIDLTGQRFGRLTVVKKVENKSNNLTKWLCKCDCGNETEVLSQDLRKGRQVSCGCNKLDRLIERNTKHGFSKTRQYRIWKGMKRRCYYKNSDDYKNYGGRGIRVCDRWLNSFENFWEDMEKGYSDELSIDRIDVDGDYCKENCKWSDKKTQSRNTRANHVVDSPLGRMTIGELAEKSGLDYHLLKRRVYDGWEGDRLLIPPMNKTHDTSASR